MARAPKQDSNITGLALAVEQTLGVLPGSPSWVRAQPNSYSGFGINLSKIAPNPINDSRQRKKGVVTDLDSNAGFNVDLDFYSVQTFLQSAFYAAFRRKPRQAVTEVTATDYEIASTTGFIVGSLVKGVGFNSSVNNSLHVVASVTPATSVSVASLVPEASPPARSYVQVVGFQGVAGDLDVVVAGDFATITSSALDFTTLGLVPGQWIFIGGDLATNRFSNAANNGFKRIRSVSANSLILDKSDQTMIAESSTTETVRIFFGDVIKNESGTDIVRETFHAERTLGAPDTAQPAQIQSEFVRGAVVNEMTINVPKADKATVDLTFVATDYTTRTGTEGPIQTGVINPFFSDIYNTSSDVVRINMSVVSSSEEAPEPLFAFVDSLSLSLSNNVTGNKALGVLGSFDTTAGTFEVSLNPSVYFGSVDAIEAVRNNSDVTIDFSFVKENKALVFDVPLLSLSTDGLNVSQDEAIILPLASDAADSEKVTPEFGHTLMVTLFEYVPNAAG